MSVRHPTPSFRRTAPADACVFARSLPIVSAGSNQSHRAHQGAPQRPIAFPAVSAGSKQTRLLALEPARIHQAHHPHHHIVFINSKPLESQPRPFHTSTIKQLTTDGVPRNEPTKPTTSQNCSNLLTFSARITFCRIPAALNLTIQTHRDSKCPAMTHFSRALTPFRDIQRVANSSETKPCTAPAPRNTILQEQTHRAACSLLSPSPNSQRYLHNTPRNQRYLYRYTVFSPTTVR